MSIFHKNGFTLQKLKLVTRQRDEDSRSQFACDVALYEPKMLVFLDEYCCDTKNSLRKYGYSLQPAMSQKLLVCGEQVSAIAIMSVCGILDVEIAQGNVDNDSYCEKASSMEL